MARPPKADRPVSDVGKRILYCLSGLGWKRAKLAKVLARAGIPGGTGFVSRLISGERGESIRPEYLYGIADALRCPDRWLWLGQGPWPEYEELSTAEARPSRALHTVRRAGGR
jgi:hypothetical protein